MKDKKQFDADKIIEELQELSREEYINMCIDLREHLKKITKND